MLRPQSTFPDGIAAGLLGDRAAEQVELVGARHGDDQVGLPEPGLHQDAQARAVAPDAHDVIDLRRVADHALADVDDRHVVSLADKLLGQRMANLAAAYNDDMQPSRLRLRSIRLHLCFLQYCLFLSRRNAFAAFERAARKLLPRASIPPCTPGPQPFYFIISLPESSVNMRFPP